jgi:hypothetical protein
LKEGQVKLLDLPQILHVNLEQGHCVMETLSSENQSDIREESGRR